MILQNEEKKKPSLVLIIAGRSQSLILSRRTYHGPGRGPLKAGQDRALIMLDRAPPTRRGPLSIHGYVNWMIRFW